MKSTSSSTRAGETFRVAINAQILPNRGHGGIEPVLVGLISSLGKLDGPEEYVLIAHAENPEWLTPFVGPNQRVVKGPERKAWASSRSEALKKALGPLRAPARKAVRSLAPLPPPSSWPDVPVSDGYYEGLGCQVLHFPYQDFIFCALPSIYNPHDLQHRHFPHFFKPGHLAEREMIFAAGIRYSETVAVCSEWGKHDLMRYYSLHPDRIQVIPWAPPIHHFPEPSEATLAEVKRKYALPTEFCLYPAMTWEHKNHIRLLEAIALLRDRDSLVVNLVCTGHKNEFWPKIEQRIAELGLQNQTRFLGIVPWEDLKALYRTAQFVAAPSLFEAGSGPLYEAWHEGTAATCSNVTSIPDQAGDAALLFDPYSVEAIAAAVGRMATSPEVRDSLRARGKRRLQDFSWERTAKAYRALYRRAAHRSLTEEDRWLLGWDWMREPNKKKEGGA